MVLYVCYHLLKQNKKGVKTVTTQNKNTVEEIGRLVNMLNEQQKARLLGFCEGLVLSGLKESEDEQRTTEADLDEHEA